MRRSISVALAVLMAWLPCFEAAAAMRYEPGAFSKVITAEVQGLVFYSDGETPATDLPVRIWDIEKREFIYEDMTDENGYFELPKLEPGRYFVTFDWMKIELLVVEKASVVAQQPHDIVVVIPRGLGFVSINQLTALLLASTMSFYEFPPRERKISP